MKEQLKKLMLDTVSKLVKKGLTQEEATNQVIDLVILNKDEINDIAYIKILLDGLVNIS